MAKGCGSGGKMRGGSMPMGGKSSGGKSSKSLKTPGGIGVTKSRSGPIKPTDRKNSVHG